MSTHHTVVIPQVVLVASLNNKAAAEIRAGDYMAARNSLFDALVATKKNCTQLQQDAVFDTRSTSSSTGEAPRIVDFCSFLPDGEAQSGLLRRGHPSVFDPATGMRTASIGGRGGPQETHPEDLQEQHQDSYSTALFLFRKPLHVNLQQLEQQLFACWDNTGARGCCIQTLSFTTIYNLALCHHLQAAGSVPSSSFESRDCKNLNRAAVLYTQAARLLVSASSDHGAYNPMFTIAVCNNLGHAYSALYSPQQAYQCFQQLATSITNYSSEEGEELDVGFISNAMSVALGLPATAAAA